MRFVSGGARGHSGHVAGFSDRFPAFCKQYQNSFREMFCHSEGTENAEGVDLGTVTTPLSLGTELINFNNFENGLHRKVN